MLATLEKAQKRQPPKKAREIDYPDREGPLAESDLHFDEIRELIATLLRHYKERDDVYVAGCNYVYYEEGNPKARFSPDAYVVFGVKQHQKRSFKTWIAGQVPSVAFEVSSRRTFRVDIGAKKELCEGLGVKEYFLYDPERAYIVPRLQGHRLGSDGRYAPIVADANGDLFSKQLGLKLRLDANGMLRFVDLKTGVALPMTKELLEAARNTESALRLATEARKSAEDQVKVAEVARKAAESEVERLKEEMKRLKGR